MRVESNREQLKKYTEELAKLNNSPKQLSKGQELEGLESLCLHNERVLGNLSNTDESGDKDGKSGPDESNVDKVMPIIFGSCLPGAKTAVRPLKLPKVENVPPYTTWIYLDRSGYALVGEDDWVFSVLFLHCSRIRDSNPKCSDTNFRFPGISV